MCENVRPVLCARVCAWANTNVYCCDRVGHRLSLGIWKQKVLIYRAPVFFLGNPRCAFWKSRAMFALFVLFFWGKMQLWLRCGSYRRARGCVDLSYFRLLRSVAKSQKKRRKKKGGAVFKVNKLTYDFYITLLTSKVYFRAWLPVNAYGSFLFLLSVPYLFASLACEQSVAAQVFVTKFRF